MVVHAMQEVMNHWQQSLMYELNNAMLIMLGRKTFSQAFEK
jgi:hypothetical protein